MLVLKRREGERVRIVVGAVEAWVTVYDIDRGHVRLGFDAPEEVVIEREEIIKAKGAGGADGRP